MWKTLTVKYNSFTKLYKSTIVKYCNSTKIVTLFIWETMLVNWCSVQFTQIIRFRFSLFHCSILRQIMLLILFVCQPLLSPISAFSSRSEMPGTCLCVALATTNQSGWFAPVLLAFGPDLRLANYSVLSRPWVVKLCASANSDLFFFFCFHSLFAFFCRSDKTCDAHSQHRITWCCWCALFLDLDE